MLTMYSHHTSYDLAVLRQQALRSGRHAIARQIAEELASRAPERKVLAERLRVVMEEAR